MTGEGELMARFAGGKPGSTAELYRAYGRLVYMATYQVLGDAGLAEDATRRTFVVARQRAATFDSGRALGPWLATIAGRAAGDIDNQRHRHRTGPAFTTTAVTAPETISQPPSAEQIYNSWLVRSALDRLSDQDREIIRLQHHQQLTQTEISDRLNIPLESVNSRSHRAHRRLAGLVRDLRADRGTATQAAAYCGAGKPDPLA